MRMLSSCIILTLSTAAMVACGGGSGGDGDGSAPPAASAALALNAQNGQRMAAAVVADGDDLAGDGDSPFFVPPIPSIPESGTYPCPDGGTYTLEVATPLEFNLDNCAQVDETQSGFLTVRLLDIEGDPFNSPTSDWFLAAEFAVRDLTATSGNRTLRFDDGGFTSETRYVASETRRTLAINGAYLHLTNNDDAARITNFDIEATTVGATSQNTLRYDLEYDDRSFAGTVTVRTDIPFSNLEGDPPESGKLTITGAGNTKVVVEAAGGGTARISIDANGDDDFTDSEDRVINGQWTAFFG